MKPNVNNQDVLDIVAAFPQGVGIDTISADLPQIQWHCIYAQRYSAGSRGLFSFVAQ
ncbi:hypothetical protein [Methylophaga nitratireducenticrescens]|uniref:Uncharacterized protein n=1 Tax=Methylophaga nitratireducenticrescens TaxID=754476 RepID=I1XF72_METNJ|nr:hypothetical protein [Methylophaga nitratireducenticrescens]